MLVLLTALGCVRPAEVVAPELRDMAPSTHTPGATPVPGAHPAQSTLPTGLSADVAAVMDRYPLDGTYTYFWPPDDGVWWGTTRDVRYGKFLLSPADPEHRSNCVGLTWEIALEVLQSAAGPGPINGMGLRDMLRLRGDWFVRELGDPGAVAAVEHAGVGVRVPWDQLRRGDFLQLWWTETGGHSGIFDSYELEDDRIVGIRYWSTHPFLGGIGYWTDPVERLHAVHGARLLSPDDWSPVASADGPDLARDVPPPPGGQGP